MDVKLASCLAISLWLSLVVLALQAEKCTENFPEVLTMEGSRRGRENGRETRLIPSMNFSCGGTIVGFTITSRNMDGAQDPRIQIWRENKAQCGFYYKQLPDIVIEGASCDNVTVLDSLDNVRITHCSLVTSKYTTVRVGDILGIELPRTDNDDFELYFTDGGPTNYVFRGRISSPTASLSSASTTNEQPQITLDIISDPQCSTGVSTVTSEGSGVGTQFSTITRIIPELAFTCNGTLSRLVVGGRQQPGNQDPKIQIWRESTTVCGTYNKQVPDIPINASACDGGGSVISPGVFNCTLKPSFRVPVQAGDILGLEIPPTNNYDFELFFASGGPKNYVFQNQLSSSTSLSGRSMEVDQQPQIHIVVDTSSPTTTTESTISQTDTTGSTAVTQQGTTSPVTQQTTSMSSTSGDEDTSVITGAASGGRIGATVAGVIIALIFLAALMAVVVIIAVMITRKRGKRFSTQNRTRSKEIPMSNPLYEQGRITSMVNDIDIYETPIDGGFDYEDVDDKEHDLGAKDVKAAPNGKAAITTPEYSGNYYSPVPQSESTPNENNYESPIQTLPRVTDTETVGTLKGSEAEEETYWEPSNDANELYQQLSSKRYREIDTAKIQLKRVLGSGQFGTVNHGSWQSPMGALDVAVKQLKPGASKEEKVKFLREAAINGQFRHPNVVKLMGVVKGNGPTMIVLELLSNGDLLNFLINQRPNPGETVSAGTQEKLLRFCQHVASGMSYLSSKSFIHRDLAARNILVSEDRICKISDFGMSRDVEDENYYVSSGGKVPVKWTAPEAIHFKKYSTASDVWSFGCVMYEIWSLGHKPFEIYSNIETVRLVDKGFILPPPPGLSKELYKIMIQCWKPESSRRPTFPQLVEMLSRAEFELFEWEEEDIKDQDDQVKVIGAPLEAARNLYPELQQSYVV